MKDRENRAHVVESSYGTTWIEDGVLFYVYKSNVIIDLKAAKEIIAERTRLLQGEKRPLLTDIRGVRYFDKEARDFFARASGLVKCNAVLADSPASRLITDFYISVNKPVTPIKIFTDREEAIRYLQSFRTDD